jgi:shikimate dehydrogenase
VKEPVQADVLVNATSVGLDPATTEDQALRELRLTTDHRPQTTLIDLPYREDGQPTPLVRWASNAVDGIEVLIHQGARSFELWTGLEAPLEVMREAVRSVNRAPAA